jgi:hypothetical protein
MRLILTLLIGAWAATAQQAGIPMFTTPSTPVAVSTDCAVDGTVVDHITHRPVPRARVILNWPGGTRSGAADNSGNWSLSGVGCARVAVRATRFGYLDSNQSSDGPLTVPLAADSPGHVTIEMTPQAVISGKVVDENGDPVMGVRVIPNFARVQDGRRQLTPAGQSVTDDRGEFRMPRLEPGRYVVCVEPAMGQGEYPESCYPSPLEGGVASAMKLLSGQESEIDFNLSRVHPVRVSGTLTGLPAVTGGTVELLHGTGRNLEPSMGAGVRPDGRFVIPNVAPGSYTLVASSALPGREPLQARVPLEVGGSDIDNLVIALQSPLEFSGTVHFESQNGPPEKLPRIEIAFRSAERGIRMPFVAFGEDKTSFTVNSLPGTYTLQASAPGFYLKSATLGGRDISHGEFSLDAASGPFEIVFSDNGGTMEGDVMLDDGSPAANAFVVLLREGELVRMIPVSNGGFSAYNLPPGDYKAYAWDGMRNVEYADPAWMEQNGGGGVAVTVAAGQTAQVKLARQTAPAEY